MISRRAFLQGLAAAAAGGVRAAGPAPSTPQSGAAVAAPPSDVAAPTPEGSETIRQLYRRALVIDALTGDGSDLDARAALSAGLSAAVVDLTIFPRNLANARQCLADWDRAFAAPGALLLRVLQAADLVRAKREGKLGIALACQDAAILDSSTFSVNDLNLKNLRELHGSGLRVLQLTHNERNGVGDSFREKVDAGLSRLGEAVVAEMNQLGMLIDLSHCSDQTTLQAIRLSVKPCAVTHAGCRALYPTLRNKTDEQLRELARHGGFFGVYNMSVWLTDRDTPELGDLLDHVDHAVRVAGIEHVGFGSDGPVVADTTPLAEELAGHQKYARRNLGLPGSERMPKHVTLQALNAPDRLLTLAAGLYRRGYKEDAIEKIIGANFARVFAASCG